jgi:hypothetical protein
MSEEIVDQAFVSVAKAIEKEYSVAKTAAENGAQAAKQKALNQLISQ